MRGADLQQDGLYRYLSPETWVSATHPLRPIRRSIDTTLAASSLTLASVVRPNRSSLHSAGEEVLGFNEKVAT